MYSGPSLAQEGRQDFTIVNRTGFEIEEIYVSPTRSNSWQENLLAQEVLDDGASSHVHFNGSSSNCYWDLKVVYLDDSAPVWKRINLCAVSTVTLYYNANTDKTSADIE